MKKLALVFVILSAVAFAKTPQKGIKHHALAKVGRAAVKVPGGILGSIVFTTEIGVDVVHVAFVGADKFYDDVPVLQKVPGLDVVYLVVDKGTPIVAKVDTGLETLEMDLWGTSN